MAKQLTQKSSTELASRNLTKMLGKIAKAETMETQCRRARDAEGMYKAIKQKIEEQAKYIVLRDAAVAIMRSVGGPGRGKHISSTRVVFPEGDPGDQTAWRWRKAFCEKNSAGTTIDSAKMIKALEDARERCRRICEQENLNTVRGTEGTGEFERYTPSQYVEMARNVMGSIDLDPASCELAQKTVKATEFYTIDDDGLAQEWHGNIWLNPPYHRDLGPRFIDKLLAEWDAGRIRQAIVLTNNSTDTDWFDNMADACQAICFANGRIRFLEGDGITQVKPTQGQSFFYLGPDRTRFCAEFSEIGFVLIPLQ